MARKKKGPALMVDEKKGHLFFGEKLRLLMLRPIELIEFCEFAGVNADDILIWVGKSVGKYFVENIPEDKKDWTMASMHDKKEMIIETLRVLESLGYGILACQCKKNEIYISVSASLSEDEKENIMAKSVCFMYHGIFNGILDALELDGDGEEVKCHLLGDEACVFKFEFLMDEFDDEDIDEESTSEGGISSFLSSL